MRPSPLELMVSLLCGLVMIAGSVGILAFGSGPAVPDTTAVLLLSTALAGVGIVASALHAVVQAMVPRHAPARRPDRDVFRLS